MRPRGPRGRGTRNQISIHAPQWGATVHHIITVHGGNLISIHAPQWGATATHTSISAGIVFQSTHPSGVRPFRQSDSSGFSRNFNPRTPVGCDRQRGTGRGPQQISIHAPQWGATNAYKTALDSKWNFNPRTPVGCDTAYISYQSADPKFQSTHPSGVRLVHLRFRRVHVLFQSTHPSGVRPRKAKETVQAARNFNPRTPVGCDTYARVNSKAGRISIHAPQWGATGALPANDLRIGFQSTHPSGVRPGWYAPRFGMCLFQSTHPSGVRLILAFTSSNAGDFNPRTPVGCDHANRILVSTVLDFNPRTPVGCDVILAFTSSNAGVFQSTHPSGVRPGIVAYDAPVFHEISIHAPQWGATEPATPFHNDRKFQSTHPSGVRPRTYVYAIRLTNFNPRTPVGCDSLTSYPVTCASIFQSTHPSGVRRCRSIGMVRW